MATGAPSPVSANAISLTRPSPMPAKAMPKTSAVTTTRCRPVSIAAARVRPERPASAWMAREPGCAKGRSEAMAIAQSTFQPET